MIEYTFRPVDLFGEWPMRFHCGFTEDGKKYAEVTIWDDEHEDRPEKIVTLDPCNPDDVYTIVLNLESILLAGPGPVEDVCMSYWSDESDEDGPRILVRTDDAEASVLVNDAQMCLDICKAAREWYGKVVGQ